MANLAVQQMLTRSLSEMRTRVPQTSSCKPTAVGQITLLAVGGEPARPDLGDWPFCREDNRWECAKKPAPGCRIVAHMAGLPTRTIA